MLPSYRLDVFRFCAFVAILILGFNSAALAQATFTDSIAVTLTTYHKTVTSGDACNIFVYSIGTFPDVKGNGRDSDYRYQGFYDGGPWTYYYSSGVPADVGAPDDEPGVLISYTSSQSWTAGGGPCNFELLTGSKAFAGRYKAFALYQTTERPVAFFDWEKSGGLKLRLDGSESYVATEHGHESVSSFLWDFGNGTTGTEPSPTVEYAEAGNYTVSLTVTDDNGQEDTVTREVEVGGAQLLVYVRVDRSDAIYGDSLGFVGFVYNEGTEDAHDVVIPNSFAIEIDYKDGGCESTTMYDCPVDKTRITRRGDPAPLDDGSYETIPVLRPGEFRQVERRYGSSKLPTVYQPAEDIFEIPEYYDVTLEGVSFKDAQGKIGRVHQLCETDEEQCTNKVKVSARAYQLSLNVFTSIEEVRTGLAYRQDAFRNVSFVEPQSSPYICRTGCVEVQATVLDEDGVPVTDRDVTLEAAFPLAARISGTQGGDFMCERGDENVQPGNCSDRGYPLVLTPDAEGTVKAWYALPAIIDPTNIRFEASVTNTVSDRQSRSTELTVKPAEYRQLAYQMGPFALQYTNLLSSLSGAAGAVNLGEHCENQLKWIRTEVDGTTRMKTFNRNMMFTGSNVLIPWTCTVAVATHGLASPMDAAISTISLVADPVKKVLDIFDFMWFSVSFGLSGQGFIEPVGPLPPPLIFWFQGDLLDFITAAIPDMVEAGVGVGYTLTLIEASSLLPPSEASVDLVDYWRVTDGHENAIRVVLDNGSFRREGLITIGYSASSWINAQDGFTELPERMAAASANATSVSIPDLAAADGDYIQIDGPDHSEINQVVSSSTSQSGKTAVVELARPLRYSYADETPVGIIASGTLDAPVPPMLVPVMSGIPPDTLAWLDEPLSVAATYDVQVALDTLFTDPILEQTAITTRELAVQVGTFDLFTTYYIRARSTNALGTGGWSYWQSFTPVTNVGVEEEEQDLPVTQIELDAPYPNPMQGRSTIEYALPSPASVRLAVYDLLGRELVVLADGQFQAGRYSARIDGSSFASGIYFVRLVAGDIVRTRQIVRVNGRQ